MPVIVSQVKWYFGLWIKKPISGVEGIVFSWCMFTWSLSPDTDARFFDATEKLRTYFSNVCAYFEAELVEMDGEPDHVHLLINYPPKLAISSLVNSLKGVSGRLLRRDRPDIAVRYYYKGVLWSAGYFASSCGGAPISVIRQYIEQQQTPGQVENRTLYPRPEGWGFTAHRIKSAI